MHTKSLTYPRGFTESAGTHPCRSRDVDPDKLIRFVGGKAMEALLFEVSATPKPGLVDRNNSGAHQDMDFFTFMSSAAALHDVFGGFVRIGLAGGRRSPKRLLPALQRYGMEAERNMFAATLGINTHKGMIFSLGLVCGAVGCLVGVVPSARDVGPVVADMCAGLCAGAFDGLRGKPNLTKGERMYIAHGFTGARGEAESGFQTIYNVSYPVLCELSRRNIGMNDALVHTLLHLIACTIDTNIVSRHDLETAEYARRRARNALELGGMLTRSGVQAVHEMDADFIKRHISPGGCADLLAVTYLLRELETAFESGGKIQATQTNQRSF